MQPPTLIPEPAWKPNPVSAIVLANQGRIPSKVRDLESFRRWALSEECPKQGWFSYLHGDLWVDTSMEQLFTHNRVKTKFTMVLGHLVDTAQLGYFFADRARLTSPRADLSTEPDGLICTWNAIKTGRVRLVPGTQDGFVELEGTPDLVLEIVSSSSVQKDTELLPQLYWRAGIPEYWLVDARGDQLRFEIMRYTPEGYVHAEPSEWVVSAVLARKFRLTGQIDPLGNPAYSLEWELS